MPAVAAVLLAGCGVGGDGHSAVDAQRAKPFQRYDFVQAMAANGGVVARVDGGEVRPVAHPDAAPVLLAAIASLEGGERALVVGGAGGLVRVVSTEEADS